MDLKLEGRIIKVVSIRYLRSYVNQASRPCIIPDRFDGSVPWRDYKEHFEACAVINDWADKENARFLAANLKGKELLNKYLEINQNQVTLNWRS